MEIRSSRARCAGKLTPASATLPGDADQRNVQELLLLARFSAEPAPLLRFRFLWRRHRYLFCNRLFPFWFFGLCLYLLWLWFRLFPPQFLFYGRFLLGCDDSSVHPFDKRHGSRVALALAEFHNARVTAIALYRSRCNVVEEFLYGCLLS